MNLKELSSTEFAVALSHRIGASRFQLWFAKQTKFVWCDSALEIRVPNRHFVEWLSERYGRQIDEVAKEMAGSAVTISFKIEPELFRELREIQAAAPLSLVESKTISASVFHLPGQTAIQAKPRVDSFTLKARHLRTLDHFYPGLSNRIPLSAAKALAQGLITAGPVLIHGQPGLGKTHLLEGIAYGARLLRPDWRILLLTAEEFLQKFLHNLRQGRMASWRRWIRSQDLLLVDDLHRLTSKPSTQEELLHCMDYMQRNGKILVVSMQESPRQLSGFIPELADRLNGGLKCQINQPDQSARGGIFRQYLERLDSMLIVEDVPEWVGKNVLGNAREIQGAAQSVWLAARMAGGPIDLPLVREVLHDLIQTIATPKRLDEIEAALIHVLKIDADSLRGKSRDRRQSVQRILACYLARRHTSASASEIGGYFGGKSHSTVLAAERKVTSWLNSSTSNANTPPGIEILVSRLEAKLQSGPG